MFDRLLASAIKQGSLTVQFADGSLREYGQGLPNAHWHFHDPRTPGRILRDPGFSLGETYMEGGWSTRPGQLAGLLKVLMQNFSATPGSQLTLLSRMLRHLQQLNPIARSARNVHHHYDLDEWLFRRFLDRDMHYSCAYFRETDMDLEQAQQAKCEHILRKLKLRPGDRVLDIGSGWGGLATYLAEHADVFVTGLTLSPEQLRVARERARELGLGKRVQFLLSDYREHGGSYDRIVSVGMFEHVGVPHYRTFFEKVRSLLKEDGVMLLHTIGRLGPPTTTNSWIRRYIFPGGYIPALSETAKRWERARLFATDVEVLRLHYSRTLAEWQNRFQANRRAVIERFGERFARMWEFYLAVSEASFHLEMVVFQIQMSRSLTALPFTRDYLYNEAPPAENVRRIIAKDRT